MSADILRSSSTVTPRQSPEDWHAHPASEDQKLFVVLSVAIATACFLVNAVVMVALLSRRFCLSPCLGRRRWRRAHCPSNERHYLNSETLYLSQAVAGILASAACLYPIQLIAIQGGHLITSSESSQRSNLGPFYFLPPDLSFFTCRTVCYLFASAPLLSSVFATLGTNVLMALEQHLLLASQFRSRDPRKSACSYRCGATFLPIGLATVWLGTSTLAVLPVFGPGSRWGGFCVLPGAWADAFTAVVAALLFVLVMIPVYIYSGIFVRCRGNSLAVRSSESVGDDIEERAVSSEEVPIYEPTTPNSTDAEDHRPVQRVIPSIWRAKANFIHFCLLLVCYLPVTLHFLSRSNAFNSPRETEEFAAFIEKDSTLPWTSMLVVLAGFASPLVYLFVDDELPGLTVELTRSPVCDCNWSAKKNVSIKSVSVDSDDDVEN